LKRWGFNKYSTESAPKKKEPKGKKHRLQSHRTYDLPVQGDLSNHHISTSHARPSEAVLQYHTAGNVSNPYNYGFLGQDSVAGIRISDMPEIYASDRLNVQDSEGRTKLHRAIVNQDVDLIKRLLHSGWAVDISDHRGNEPLHYAIIAANVEVVKLLLRFGADPDAKDKRNRSPAHLAVSVSGYGCLEQLIKCGSSVSAKNDNGDSPLHLAVLSNERECIKILLKHGADVNLRNPQGATPFHVLITQSYTDWHHTCIELFLASGADITIPRPDDRLPFDTYLSKAQKIWIHDSDLNGNQNPANKSFKAFLKRGVDATHMHPDGNPLVISYLRGISKGLQDSEPWDTFDMESAQSMCGTCDHSVRCKDGNTLLHEICSLRAKRPGKVEFFREVLIKLLKNGFDPNARNTHGQTPLMLLNSHYQCSTDCARILLDAGADPMVRSNWGGLEICYVSMSTNTDMLDMMLQADVKFIRANRSSILWSDIPTERGFWEFWERAVKETDWPSARASLNNCKPKLRDDADQFKIKDAMLRTLARSYLDEDIGKDEPNLQRELVVDILRLHCEKEWPVKDKYWNHLLRCS
jgi:ankyrin repeat protein